MTDLAERAEPWVPVDSFGARLALVRQKMGWNATEAARLCGLDKGSRWNWENGVSCRDRESVARKISDATGCDYRWLLAGGPLTGNSCFGLAGPTGQMELALSEAPSLAIAG